MTDCHLCHGPCDPEFHAMNADLHGWLRADVTRYLDAGLMPAPGPRKVPKPTPKSEAAKSIGQVPPSLAQRPVGRPTLKWVTTAWVLKRQSEGLTHPQIAKEAGCGIALIAKRLHSAIGTPAWKALRVCACGKSKKPASPACARCVSKSKATGTEYSRLREIGKQREAQA